MSARILIVDDDTAMLEALASMVKIRMRGIDIDSCQSAVEALTRVDAVDYDAIVSDIKMPGMDGLALMEQTQKIRPTTPTLLISGHGDRDFATRALEAGAYAFINKPIDRDFFIAWLKRAIQLRHLNRVVEQQNVKLEELVQERTTELDWKNKELQRALEAQAHLTAIVASAEDAIISKDLQGIIRSWNKGAERLFGYTAEEIIGKSVMLLIPEGRRDEEPRILERIRAGERLEHYETVRRRKDGTEIEISLTVSPITDPTGQVIGASKIARDITERKRAEELVRETQQRYRHMVHALPAAVYTCDAQGRVLLYNEAAVDLWGRAPEAGKDLWCGSWRIYELDGRPMPLESCPMAVAIREGRPIRGKEIVVERPDGTRANVLPYPTPLHDASGVLIGAVNMLVDITERKRAEAAVAHLAAIVADGDDAFISKDLNGIVTSWNKAAEDIFGYTADEMIGQPVTLLIPPGQLNEEPEILERVRAGERIERYQTVWRRKDGREIQISLTVSPITDAKGRVIGASKIVRDITQWKQTESILDQLREKVKFANQRSQQNAQAHKVRRFEVG
jgi:PAS domain S-box-containing protein